MQLRRLGFALPVGVLLLVAPLSGQDRPARADIDRLWRGALVEIRSVDQWMAFTEEFGTAHVRQVKSKM